MRASFASITFKLVELTEAKQCSLNYKLYARYQGCGRNSTFNSGKKEMLYAEANFISKFSFQQISKFVRNAVKVNITRKFKVGISTRY